MSTKKVLQEVCKKFDGAEELIKDKIEEIRSNEKLSVEEIAYLFMKDYDNLKLKLVMFVKMLQSVFKTKQASLECSVTTLIFFYSNSMT